MQGPGPTAEPRQTNRRWGKGHGPARELLLVSGKGARDALGIGHGPASFSRATAVLLHGRCQGLSRLQPGEHQPRGERGSAPGRCGAAGGRFAPGLPFRAGRSAAVPPLEGSHILTKPPGPTPPPPARGSARIGCAAGETSPESGRFSFGEGSEERPRFPALAPGSGSGLHALAGGEK